MEYLVTANLAHRSGLAKDRVSHSFAIQSATPWDPATELGEMTIPLTSFYNTVVPGFFSIGSMLSGELSRAANGIEYDVYRLDTLAKLQGGPKGSPVATDRATLVAAGTAAGPPTEVAYCLSYRDTTPPLAPEEAPDGADADLKPDRPASRRRGRVFLGPLNNGALTIGALGEARPVASFRDTVLGAAERLFDELKANLHTWSVWSRQDGEFRGIEEIWVDDAFDTQRRRGVSATAKIFRIVNP